jgi:hypothetical protein
LNLDRASLQGLRPVRTPRSRKDQTDFRSDRDGLLSSIWRIGGLRPENVTLDE